MNTTVMRIVAGAIAVSILIAAWVGVSSLPKNEPGAATTTTKVLVTLPDTVATLPPVTDPQVGTSFSN